MIDSHTHSKYSKHAVGEIEEVVISAIKNNVKILTITDHAPFLIDTDNRLLMNELEKYFSDIEYVQNKYKHEIKILKGIEADYIPQHHKYTENLISSLDLDFIIGSVHSVFLKEERINVWDIKKLNNKKFLDEYFIYLKELINSKFFDSIGHPDSILRGGILEQEYYDRFYPLIKLIKDKNISYELNASGLRKSTYNLKIKKKEKNVWNYPSKNLVRELSNNSISFTIGSDAHSPFDVNKGVQSLLKKLEDAQIESISYYENRIRKDINIYNIFKVN